MEAIYTIGELVQKLNINKETIRYYEKIGLLDKADKDRNGYRIYGNNDIDKIQFICMVKKLGFRLKEIKLLIDDEILYGDFKNIKLVVDEKLNEIDILKKELEEKEKLLKRVKEILISDKVPNCNEIKKIL
ncbi:MerR family transcriptional regulator [Clostridium sp. LP20]|uniref:MerR family transcriptional regulator n=1 Tax=Clostridium sp. LP20 TaxID=3418665 RepID=UPI003EE72167